MWTKVSRNNQAHNPVALLCYCSSEFCQSIDEIIGNLSLDNWQQGRFEDSFNAHPGGKSHPGPYYWASLYTEKKTTLLSAAVKPVVGILSLKKENVLGY